MTTPSVGSALRKAKSYEASGEHARAAEIYTTILSKYPGNKRAKQAVQRLPRGKVEGHPTSVSAARLQSVFTYLQQGNTVSAAAAVQKLIDAYPGSAAVWNAKGIVQGQLGNASQAEACFDKAIDLNPEQAEFWHNKGVCLEAAERPDDALQCYEAALRVDAEHLGAAKNLGDLFQRGRNWDAAVRAYQQAVSYHPEHPILHEQIGHCLYQQGLFEPARAAYRIAVSAMPDQGSLWAQIDLCTRRMCDWEHLDEVTADRYFASHHAAPSWGALMRADDPGMQLQVSRAFAKRLMPNPEPMTFESGKPRSGRLRVGFFSADFHTHATVHLTSGLFRSYDRAKFEFILFSYGAGKAGAARTSLKKNVDVFHDVAGYADADIVDLARHSDLDIAIDLKGFTLSGRSELFAQRLAPVHLNYLGYPGSLGSAAYDYIVADRVVIPPDLEWAYDEHILRLPESFQPNDETRVINADAGSRSDHGLNAHGFVFCNFNHAAKIGPREFDLWTGVLRDTPGSQFWLLEDNPWSTDNLRAAAQARGVDPERLVFAPRTDNAAHLARHRHADLFLDSLTCNAHTTAADALWSGLPLITRQGDQFAARVASSLLTAAGLEDLIAKTDEDYAALARSLSRAPDLLHDVQRRVLEARTTAPLFDTKNYVRAFQDGLNAVFARWQSGLLPVNMTIGNPT